jgi:hypothetical protein
VKIFKIYEVNDKVRVAATKRHSVAYRNAAGGTSTFPPGTVKECWVIKTWEDYETGRRYIGITADKQAIFFSEFNDIELVEDES